MAVKGRRVSHVRVSKGKRLQEIVNELEEKLANSVPKTEVETVRSNLESRIAELERSLSESVPKTTLDAAKKDLKAKITDLDARLSESVPRSEADLGAEVGELKGNLDASKSVADSLRAQVGQLEARLAESIPKAESEAKMNELETKLSAARRELQVA